MDDLIDRQAALDAIHCNIVVTGRENAELVAKTIGEFADRIKALPTIQPEPQEGKWVYGEDFTADCVDGYRCSRCGFFVPWDYNHKLIDYINDYVYCPKCGAKMGGKTK